MSKALYRKYRSTSLAEVVGQNHITDILSRALASGRIAHAYLFTGPRGVGKTSIARILAHEINQLPYTDEATHLDIIEIDAASNNGVEDVRDLREKVHIAPVSAAKKVYIIDEVHMLSKPAFNALLKTLEEPPEHVVFILATTDVEKLPATIISRTQRYGFKAINPADAVSHLKHIAKQEKIKVSDDALALIAERGDGSFRDSISLLDQLSSLADGKEGITTSLVETSLGLAPASIVHDILHAVDKHDIAAIATHLTATEADGISALVLTDQIVRAVREQVPEKPQLLQLLDALLDVPKSTQPAMKLLSVLGSFAVAHKPKTAALNAPPLEVSASVKELSRPTIKPAIQNPAPASETTSFDWVSLVEHTRHHYVALYSVLSKCTGLLEGDTLTIYAVNAFYKKKLDDPKYSAHLYESLQTTTGKRPTIHTLPTRAALKDSQAATVADIMGGGIEVSVEAL